MNETPLCWFPSPRGRSATSTAPATGRKMTTVRRCAARESPEGPHDQPAVEFVHPELVGEGVAQARDHRGEPLVAGGGAAGRVEDAGETESGPGDGQRDQISGPDAELSGRPAAGGAED